MTVNFTRGLSDWTAGTATVANASRTVTFASANLIAADPSNSSVNIYVAGEGDFFIVDGIGAVPIKSVDSASQVTLDYPWPAATQTAVAYVIRRYNEVKTGEVAKYIQAAQTVGQDSNPPVSWTIDDGVSRAKLRESGSAIQLAVGNTGAADASLKAGLQIDPTTAAASFPNGIALPSTGFRNRIINGNFDIWQRGTSLTNVYGGGTLYHADRWQTWNGGSGSTLAITKVSAPSGFVGLQAINFQATAFPVGQFQVTQKMEARMVADMDGVAATISFDINATTSAGTITGTVSLNANTAVDNGTFSTALVTNLAFTMPVGTGRVTVPISAAQTVGFKYGVALTINIFQNTSAGNINVSLGAVQLEKGAVTNPFEFRPLPVELAMCQRYFETSYNDGIVPGTATGVGSLSKVVEYSSGTSYATLPVVFKVRKRVNPTITMYSPQTGASGKMYATNAAADFASTAYSPDQSGFRAQLNGAAISIDTIALQYTASAEL